MPLEKPPEWYVDLWQLDVELESLFQSTVLISALVSCFSNQVNFV